MKIIAETPTLLKLRQHPIPMYLMGLFLLGAAIWAMVTQLLTAPMIDWRLGGVILFLAGLGTAVLLFTHATTVIFDKTAGTVTIRRYSLLHQVQKEYLLSGIKQVTVYSGREFDPSAYFVSRTYHLLLMMKKSPQVQLAGGGKLQLSRLNNTAIHIHNFLFE
ncbi:MAG: hypothetical protein GY796_37040 [Chloroflexi bacterium]|nr:hypothetical protein [Chloroflexota bacterium]